MVRRQTVAAARETGGVDGAGHDGEARRIRAQPRADLVYEGGAADQQGVGVGQHLAHRDAVGLAA